MKVKLIVLFVISLSCLSFNACASFPLFGKKETKPDAQQYAWVDAYLKKLNKTTNYKAELQIPYPLVKTIWDRDIDGDGIPDRLDDCPTIFGVASRNGCPAIDVTKMITVARPTILFTDREFTAAVKAFADLEFDGGNLLPESHDGLDEFVRILKNKPTWCVCLSAYVDDTPDENVNYNLSKIRMEKVKKYLTTKGIESKRISGKCFGDTMPVIDLPDTRFEVELDYSKTAKRTNKKR